MLTCTYQGLQLDTASSCWINEAVQCIGKLYRLQWNRVKRGSFTVNMLHIEKFKSVHVKKNIWIITRTGSLHVWTLKCLHTSKARNSDAHLFQYKPDTRQIVFAKINLNKYKNYYNKRLTIGCGELTRKKRSAKILDGNGW